APFTFAAALRGGDGLGLFLDDFTDARVADPVTLRVAANVTCVRDERCDEMFPECFPAIVTVQVAGKGTERVEILENRGGPTRPRATGEASTKFRACARRVLDEATVATLDAALASLDELSDLRPVVSLLG